MGRLMVRIAVSFVVLAGVICSSLSLQGAEERAGRGPNFVVILMDDMGWRDVGFMGNKFVETPHLDRLARGGLVFGVLGYAFKKLSYPLAPLVLALVLGDMAESSFRQSMLISKGSLGVFFESGLSASITLLALLMLVWPLINKLKSSKGNGQLISS